ncbi:hypothetical protein QQ045_030384 [Rhodiola kirilowii]
MIFNAEIIQGLDESSLSWKKPKGAYYKANCDASWDPDTKEGGIGVIIRDVSGVIIGLSRKYFPYCYDVYYAEGLALNEALVLAEKLKLKHVIFETDNKDIVLSINCKLDHNVWRTSWYLNCCRMMEKV